MYIVMLRSVLKSIINGRFEIDKAIRSKWIITKYTLDGIYNKFDKI